MRALVIAVAALLAACSSTPDNNTLPFSGGKPLSEQEIAQARVASGPIANRGIESVKNRGSVPLLNEIPGAGARTLRVREIVIDEKGVLGTHRHEHQPGFGYILEGELTEIRSDSVKPIVHGPGSISFEWTGIAHYWENRGDDPVRLLLVDIVADELR